MKLTNAEFLRYVAQSERDPILVSERSRLRDIAADLERHDAEEIRLIRELREAREETERATAELDRIYSGIQALRVRT